jgi:hypothetical protein
MNKLILATGANLGYLHKISKYLKTIQDNSNFDGNYLIFLDKDPLTLPLEKVKVSNVYHEDVEMMMSNYCLQHGEFLKSKDFFNETNDDDVIFFTDADMELQRPLSEEEITTYKNFKDDEIYVGYNANPNDTLQDESVRLWPTGYESHLLKHELDKIKVYNTGVLAMNKKTWVKVTKEFIELYPEVDKTFTHYAKQQWLLSFIFGTKGYKVYEMPYDIHNHTHYPSPEGSRMDENGTVYYNNKVVLFKHKWF